MAVFTKQELTGAADGVAVLIAATATAGTLIHTAHATAYDELWLWAYNSHTADLVLTIEWGGVTDPTNHIVQTIPFDAGLVPVVPGLILTNSLVCRAFAGTTNLVTLSGFVNRVT